MHHGIIVFKVTKVGMAVNSQWEVLVDGKYVGNIDFNNELCLPISRGKHSVQYKIGLQSTKELSVDVGEDEVLVECMFDGSAKNFFVHGENVQEVRNKVVKKSKIVKLIGVICLAIGLLWACVDANQGAKTAIVKEGHFNGYPNETVGAAFSDFFVDCEWKSFKAKGKQIVEFSGECTWDGQSADALIQFEIYDDDSFGIYHMSIDGKNLNELETALALAVVMES